MINFITKLKNLSTKDQFMLELSFYPKGEVSQPFKLSNNFRSLEKRELKIEDSTGTIIKGFHGSLNPKDLTEVNTIITKTKPFVYIAKGEIYPHEDKLIVEVSAISCYELEIGQPYYFYFEYEDYKSEKLEIIFR